MMGKGTHRGSFAVASTSLLGRRQVGGRRSIGGEVGDGWSMPLGVKDEVEEGYAPRRSSRGRGGGGGGDGEEAVVTIPSRVKGKVALRSDRAVFRRTLRERKEKVIKDDDTFIPARRPPSKLLQARKRARPPSPCPPDSPASSVSSVPTFSSATVTAAAPSPRLNGAVSFGAPSRVINGGGAGGADGGGGTPGPVRGMTTTTATTTPAKAGAVVSKSHKSGMDGGGGGVDGYDEEDTRKRSPGSWSYLEVAEDEMTGFPHVPPILNKIKMTKYLQSLSREFFDVRDSNGKKVFESDPGLGSVKAAIEERLAACQYRSFFAFKTDVEMYMRKHCGSAVSSSVKEVIKKELMALIARFKSVYEQQQQHQEAGSAVASPRSGGGGGGSDDYITLSQIRQELCEGLKTSGLCLRKPEPESPPLPPLMPIRDSKADAKGKGGKRKGRQRGLGRGKAPVDPPYKLDVVAMSESDEEEDEGGIPSFVEQLVISKQPPEMFVSGTYGGKDHHFEVEVCVPDSMRKRLRHDSAVPLVVELRYEDGEAVDQQPLHVLEEPLMFPGRDRWVVKARINATSFKHGKRKFALWLDVSQFEQRGHNVWVSGVLTDGINVVSTMPTAQAAATAAAPVSKKRKT